jgi:multidrug efflux pump
MVLAVGLVVDDAIVVLENIFRYREQGYSSLEAAKKGASEIGFAIIAMTCTLMSVFLPLVFVTDMTGTLLREFAITLASAVMFSGIVALTLSPLMSAYLLKHEPKEGRIAQAIERGIKATERGYQSLLVKSFEKRSYLFIGMFIFLGLGIFLYQRLTSDLLPKEDRGIIGASIPIIPGYDLDDMEPYVAAVEQIFLQEKGVARTIVHGLGEHMHVVSVLKPWGERSEHAEKIVANIRAQVAAIPTASAYPWSWNIGLSALEDNSYERADVVVALKSVGSYEELDEISQRLVDRMRKDNVLIDARSDLDMNEKSYSIKVERASLAALGVDEKTVSLALQAYTDRVQSSEFRLDGQRYHMYLEPDVITADLNAIYITTKNGESVPLSTVARVKPEVQAPVLKHLNQMRTANVLANLAVGQSLSEAKTYLDGVIKDEVPSEISVSFEGSIAMQKKSGQTFIMLFFAGLIFIFAVMAIQFEGILDPLIILFTVPLACLGGVLILWMTNSGTNLYTQVGMLTLIGLITKHGILLTEFVGARRREMPLKDAVFLAAQLRFRPIVMTTAATVLGAVPLVLSRGAGVEARASIGLVIVGGMIFGTLLTLFVLPSVIYSVHSAKLRFMASREGGN